MVYEILGYLLYIHLDTLEIYTSITCLGIGQLVRRRSTIEQ